MVAIVPVPRAALRRARQDDRLGVDKGLTAPRLGRAGVALFAVACAGMLCVAPAHAAGWATFPVDDSMSQTQAGAAQLRWRDALPSRGEPDLLEATMNVRIVLNVSPWIGKPARIYMLMAPLPLSSLAVQWTTSGVLLPGRLSGGQRQLVYQGIVAGARIEDLLRVGVATDARDPATPRRVVFTFEIEVPSR